MGDAEGLGHGVWSFGYDDQVDVIQYQAMTPDAQLRIAGRLGELVEAGLPVMVIKNDVAAEIAALRNVMRVANGHHSGDSCHHGYGGQTDGFFSRKIRG